jgi:fumarate hydratase subunit alpha
MIEAAAIASAVEEAVGRAAVRLRPDVLAALEAAAHTEPSERGRTVLAQLLGNARLAEEQGLPLCQDTGTVWVLLEIGAEDCVVGDVQGAVDQAVTRAYRDNSLRMSVVADSLFDRTNTGTNTPAFLDIRQRPGRGATVHVMLKGAGSDNASRLAMLDPAAGTAGVAEIVVEAIRAKGASACPPVVVGVGVGGTFDKVASLSKRALLRLVGSPAADPRAASLEAELLEAVNATGIGPGGLGGRTTALAVHVLTAPSHIAALPVAVNIGCSAMRSETVEVA